MIAPARRLRRWVRADLRHGCPRARSRRRRPGRGGTVCRARRRGGRRGSAALEIRVTLIEKAAEAQAGGNTRWSPSYMRMAAPDRVEPSFVHDMLEATKFQGDESYFARLAAEAPATVRGSSARRRVPPADLLSRQGPAAHPAGRRRPGDDRRAGARGAAAGVAIRYSARRRKASSREGGAFAASRSPAKAARTCLPTPWSSPAAASRPTRDDARAFRRRAPRRCG